jgi:hypothetical protein
MSWLAARRDGGLRNIRGVLTSVHEALTERGHELGAHSGIGALYNEMRYPIEKLEAFKTTQ